MAVCSVMAQLRSCPRTLALLSTVVLGAIAAPASQAQQAPAAVPYQPYQVVTPPAVTPPGAPPVPLDDAFNRAYFWNSPNYFNGTNLWWNINDILGFGGFPEERIRRDGAAVNDLTRWGQDRQTSDDPVLRVADANNPFDTSLSLLPQPLAQPTPVVPVFQPAPAFQRPLPPPPVRALF
ncbi:hypothetical protein PCC6311_2693 [Synechococcus elongatus PCC 6311]|uniref:Uncharacterized protein n=2 Tax=Synechococcus elongatus TaxID=32046 RepID=Q31JZ6_SYNE7|nr:conserved hypothetical protein [Synechococcus elongatus PCC 7942 = FACHB-805]AJD56924.1 hypothetical protein M744_03210 [Synechococcus elongatus UTEX 2973]MBD2587844.1 hypothetical protein [Synechococcus elongatus FACHB-242]MBD2688912.1 hypothetical protein [Synechococcus elongatus FACHB-1061]UOW72421.1 hypothetical protein PCC7943_2693 [Synechococcus elongatus PCC 7943]UOW75142.1 hypothetical protein PCC6311_2693 [Synechococcus elongatus PCC 6311]UOW77862.1 hypothetical protein PCC6301pg_